MDGVVTSVSSTSVTINVDFFVGSGTVSSWSIYVIGSGVNYSWVSLTDSSTISWDLISTGQKVLVTLGGNRTLSLSNVFSGMSGSIIVTQDGTGNRSLTLATSGYVAGQGLSTSIWLKPSANSKTCLTFEYDGSNFYWSIITF